MEELDADGGADPDVAPPSRSNDGGADLTASNDDLAEILSRQPMAFVLENVVGRDDQVADAGIERREGPDDMYDDMPGLIPPGPGQIP